MSKFLDENGLRHLVEKIKHGRIVEKLASGSTAINSFGVNENEDGEGSFSSIGYNRIEVLDYKGEGLFIEHSICDGDVVISEVDMKGYFPKKTTLHRLSDKINDAPEDDKSYIRCNNMWIAASIPTITSNNSDGVQIATITTENGSFGLFAPKAGETPTIEYLSDDEIDSIISGETTTTDQL